MTSNIRESFMKNGFLLMSFTLGRLKDKDTLPDTISVHEIVLQRSYLRYVFHPELEGFVGLRIRVIFGTKKVNELVRAIKSQEILTDFRLVNCLLHTGKKRASWHSVALMLYTLVAETNLTWVTIRQIETNNKSNFQLAVLNGD